MQENKRQLVLRCMTEQVAWNKLSLLLKIEMQNTQILQLFTINIYSERFKNVKQQSLGLLDL